MTDESPKTPARSALPYGIGGGLVGAAFAIAVAIWVSNGGVSQALACPVQADRATAIDTASTGQLAALLSTGQGRSFADFEFMGPDGETLSIADFAGRKLLVNFWASWCVPCREEMPALNALAERHNSDAFMVLPINTGESDASKAVDFLAEGNWAQLPLYVDDRFAAIDRLKREAISLGLPATLLLDENGCEIAVLQGPAAWDSADGDRVIEALIAL